MNSNVFVYWCLNINTLLLALIEQSSNIEHNKAFTSFTESVIAQTQTLFFQALNGLEWVCLWVAEHKHLIFGFEQSNIKFWTNIARPISTVYTLYASFQTFLKSK